MEIKCTCDQYHLEDYEVCKIHVRCDENCMALLNPVTFEETKTALEHWQFHQSLSGCSHQQ